MEKYSSLQSSNEYINFTLKNYIDCYSDLEIEEIQRLTEVFDLLKTHRFSIGNQLVDSKALYGIKLDDVSQKETYRKTQDLNDQLAFLSKRVNLNDKKEIVFFQSITHLCDSIQFLSSEEMMDLNDMFQGIANHKQSLGNKLNDGDITFYPYDRSPKRYSK